MYRTHTTVKMLSSSAMCKEPGAKFKSTELLPIQEGGRIPKMTNQTTPRTLFLEKILPKAGAEMPAEPQLLRDFYGLTVDDMMILYKRAAETLKNKNYEESLGMFHILICLNPGNSEYHLGAALSADHLGQIEDAENYFNGAMKAKPSNPKPFVFAANHYFERGDREKAAELIVEALKHTTEGTRLHEQALALKEQIEA